MKRQFVLSVALFAATAGCSSENAKPTTGDSTTHTAASQPQKPAANGADDDAALEMSGAVGSMATGNAAATTSATAKATASVALTQEQATAEPAARTLVATVGPGRSAPDAIVLKSVKPGTTAHTWLFTYTISGSNELTVQTKDGIASFVKPIPGK